MTANVCSQFAASLPVSLSSAPAVLRAVAGRLPDLLPDLLYDESGQDLIEYALVAATVGLGTVAGINGLAASIANYLNIVDGGFNNSLAHH